VIQAVRQFCNGMSGFPLEDPLIEGFTLGIGLKKKKRFLCPTVCAVLE
jgi:hypothetical protein